MNAFVRDVAEHWSHVASLLEKPCDEAAYDALVCRLDQIVRVVGDDESHPLASLAAHMGDLIEAYDEAVRPMPPVAGLEALRYLMEEHRLGHADLPEIGPHAVVAAVLAGERRLDLDQVRALSARFDLPVDVFI